MFQKLKAATVHKNHVESVGVALKPSFELILTRLRLVQASTWCIKKVCSINANVRVH